MKVTCLCLTRNRREWLPRAIACFQAQTYQDSELLIVADGADVSDLVPADERVRLVHATASTIGEKRNAGIELALGEIVSHWDDDDWSAPERLADQVRKLRETGKAVTGYRTMAFTDGARWWEYQGAPQFALGTSLCYRRDWWDVHRFEPIQIGEDSIFVARAAAANQLVVTDAGTLMYATIHDGNTSRRDVKGHTWRPLPDFQWPEAA